MIVAQRGFQANARVITIVRRDAAGARQPEAVVTTGRRRRGGASGAPAARGRRVDGRAGDRKSLPSPPAESAALPPARSRARAGSDLAARRDVPAMKRASPSFADGPARSASAHPSRGTHVALCMAGFPCFDHSSTPAGAHERRDQGYRRKRPPDGAAEGSPPPAKAGPKIGVKMPPQFLLIGVVVAPSGPAPRSAACCVAPRVNAMRHTAALTAALDPHAQGREEGEQGRRRRRRRRASPARPPSTSWTTSS